jgi:hypothetical protein
MDGRKHTVFEAGGRVYNLRVSFNAMCMFDDQIGPVTELLKGTADSKNFVAYRGLIWCCINAYGADRITIEQAGDLCERYISENGMEMFGKAMKGIIESSGWLGKSGKDDTKNPTPPPAVSVKHSGKSSG